MSRFVRPETKVLPLSEGDSITVKLRLNAGEQRDCFTRMYLAGVNGDLKVHPFQTGLAVITAYLVDWSLRDDGGAVVPIRGLSVADLETVLNSLDPDSFNEIKDAINAHEEAMREEREREKKLRAGSSDAAPISVSPFAAAGPSSGSEVSTKTTM